MCTPFEATRGLSENANTGQEPRLGGLRRVQVLESEPLLTLLIFGDFASSPSIHPLVGESPILPPTNCQVTLSLKENRYIRILQNNAFSWTVEMLLDLSKCLTMGLCDNHHVAIFKKPIRRLFSAKQVHGPETHDRLTLLPS